MFEAVLLEIGEKRCSICSPNERAFTAWTTKQQASATLPASVLRTSHVKHVLVHLKEIS